MDLIEKVTVMHYHRHRIAESKPGSVEALGWRGERSQQARYETLVKVGDLNGCTLLDVGCGHGDLKSFLDLHYADFDYIGIDQMPEFITEAKARYGDCPRTSFYQTDFSAAKLPSVDYVFASGALGYRCKNESFYAEMISKLYHSTTVAFAFNLLDRKTFPVHDLLVGHDREAVLALCRTLSPRVEWFDGYLKDDFTVFMYRDGMNEPQKNGG